MTQRWLWKTTVVATGESDLKHSISTVHNEHHFGVNRTAYLAKKLLGQEVTKGSVEDVVRSCHLCRSVDPHPVQWSHGTLEVPEVWSRLAVDITYVQRRPYLSIIDCGPSRFVIWCRLVNETADAVVRLLNKMFFERGSPNQLLNDNGPCFCSSRMREFLARWKVVQLFSCAYRHSGNGIVERNHRTIKSVVMRSGKPVEEAVYWYNNSMRVNGVVPVEAVYRYKLRLMGEGSEDQPVILTHQIFSVWDMVYVKPPKVKCTSAWDIGKVTNIVSEQAVEVDGVYRHVGDLRFGWSEAVQDKVTRNDGGEPANAEHIRWLWEDGVSGKDGGDSEGDEDGCEGSDGEDGPDGMETKVRRSERNRQLPDRYGAYLSH